jgi:hypothetical protein
MAEGYTFSFLFSGAEHSLFEQIKLIALGFEDVRRKFYNRQFWNRWSIFYSLYPAIVIKAPATSSI